MDFVWMLPSLSLENSTSAARGMIQPRFSASKKGMQRLIVLFLNFDSLLTRGGRFLNHSGINLRAGYGSGMTPTSSAAQRNSMHLVVLRIPVKIRFIIILSYFIATYPRVHHTSSH